MALTGYQNKWHQLAIRTKDINWLSGQNAPTGYQGKKTSTDYQDKTWHQLIIRVKRYQLAIRTDEKAPIGY